MTYGPSLEGVQARRVSHTPRVVSWRVEKILEEAFKLDEKDRALVIAELSHPDANQ